MLKNDVEIALEQYLIFRAAIDSGIYVNEDLIFLKEEEEYWTNRYIELTSQDTTPILNAGFTSIQNKYFM